MWNNFTPFEEFDTSQGIEKDLFVNELLQVANIEYNQFAFNLARALINRHLSVLFPSKLCFSKDKYFLRRLDEEERKKREENPPELPKGFQHLLVNEVKKELAGRKSMENLFSTSQRQFSKEFSPSSARISPDNDSSSRKRGRPKKMATLPGERRESKSAKRRLLDGQEMERLFTENEKMGFPPEEARKWWEELTELRKQNTLLNRQLEEIRSESVRREKIMENEIEKLKTQLSSATEQFCSIIAKLRKEEKLSSFHFPPFDSVFRSASSHSASQNNEAAIDGSDESQGEK